VFALTITGLHRLCCGAMTCYCLLLQPDTLALSKKFVFTAVQLCILDLRGDIFRDNRVGFKPNKKTWWST